jgi:transcriptional regulator with XRE-family HTH domain
MQLMATTGEKLKRLRRGQGLTQVELAKRAGVAQSTIVYIERNAREEPHPSTLRRLGEALGVTPADLLED